MQGGGQQLRGGGGVMAGWQLPAGLGALQGRQEQYVHLRQGIGQPGGAVIIGAGKGRQGRQGEATAIAINGEN